MLIRRLKAAGQGWAEDQASQMGAALAYYALFSLMPLMLLGISLLARVVGDAESEEQVLRPIREYLDEDSAEAIRAMLHNFRDKQASVGTSLVGLVSLVFGASGMFTSLRSSLHRIFRLQPISQGVVFGFVKTYLLALVMVFVSCTFLIVLLLTTVAMPIVNLKWIEWFPTIPWSAPLASFAASLLSLTLLFAFTYRLLSDGRVPYRYLWLGAFVSAVLFNVGKRSMATYLAYANFGSVYGTAGSIVMFLAWVYYSAQIIFFGAEVVRAGMRPPPMSRVE